MSTPKILRRWVKEEKRIVRLLYRKGMIDDINNLYWAEFQPLRGKTHKYKGNRYSVYLPEIHFGSVDYWGEGDEHPLVDAITDTLIWDNIPCDDRICNMCDALKASTFKHWKRKDFIKYLESLPTVRCDSKINKVLNRKNRY